MPTTSSHWYSILLSGPLQTQGSHFYELYFWLFYIMEVALLLCRRFVYKVYLRSIFFFLIDYYNRYHVPSYRILARYGTKNQKKLEYPPQQRAMCTHLFFQTIKWLFEPFMSGVIFGKVLQVIDENS